MEPAQLGILAGILIPVSLFAMIFGIVYLHKKTKISDDRARDEPKSLQTISRTVP